LTFFYDTYETLVLLWTYMFIYNLSLFVLFWTLFQFTNFNTKTLFSFSDLGSTNILTKILLITILSMAGVPPFWGFFAKIFIFILLCNSYFFVLFPFFFTILFIGLYFYIQNLRFLNASTPSNFQAISDVQLRVTPIFYLFTYTFLFFLLFGFFFTEDLFLFFFWILS